MMVKMLDKKSDEGIFFLPVGLEWQEFKGVLVKNLSFGHFWRSVFTEGVFIIMDLTYKKIK